MKNNIIGIFILAFVMHSSMIGQSLLTQKEWVDSIMTTMNQDQKLGQLFMVRAFSYANNGDVSKIIQLLLKKKEKTLSF